MPKIFLKIGLALILIVVLLNKVNTLPGASAQNAVDTRFGAVEAFWAPNEAAALGIGWERILFYWNQLQPFGPADWNTLHVRDEWLAEAQAHGRTVVGLLKNTPEWATDGPGGAGVPRGLFLPVDDPGNLWATFTRRTASYYGERGVHHWIIWNEPDIAPEVYGHEFSGDMEAYYRLLKVAYQTIKSVDPSATIHLGGMTYWHDPGYLRRFLQLVRADPEAAANDFFFDVISLHIYFRPETVSSIVGSAFGIQQELGIQPMKPVWINETNARPSMDPQWPVEVQSFHVDLEQQAWYLVQAYALGFQAGAARISVYKLVDINMSPGDESWGLIRPHDFSKRPAYFAYQNVIKYLSGFTYPIQRQQTPAYTIIAFYRPQGLTRVLWARGSAPVSLQLPALAPAATTVDPISDEKVSVAAVNGVYEIELQGARCHVECLMGGPPIFVIEDGVQPGQIPTAPPPPPATFTPLPLPTETAVPPATETPPPSPTSSATPSPSETPTVMPTETQTSTATHTRLPTAVATATGTAAPSLEATPAGDGAISPSPRETAEITSSDLGGKDLSPATDATRETETAASSDNGTEPVVKGDRANRPSWLYLLGAALVVVAIVVWMRYRE